MGFLLLFLPVNVEQELKMKLAINMHSCGNSLENIFYSTLDLCALVNISCFPWILSKGNYSMLGNNRMYLKEKFKCGCAFREYLNPKIKCSCMKFQEEMQQSV